MCGILIRDTLSNNIQTVLLFKEQKGCPERWLLKPCHIPTNNMRFKKLSLKTKQKSSKKSTYMNKSSTKMEQALGFGVTMK